MPILWRSLICHFLKITLVSVVAFVSILLTMRLDEIAHFAALGAPIHYLAFFVMHQIPYILPIALPLSCLIGALLLSQKLSNNNELTALRTSGFSLVNILSPIWLTAAFLAIGNFWITSELATKSHLQNNLLKSELRSINPLLLLNNKHLMRLNGIYFEALGPSHVGESASDVVLAFPNRHHGRLHLMIAKRFTANSSTFIGEGVTLISSMEGGQEDDFDHLLVENMGKSLTEIKDFAHLLQQKVWTINNDYLQMPLLIGRIQEQKRLLEEGKLNKENKELLATYKIHLNQSIGEIMKRFSAALAVFSFTLMGSVFGINISRRKNYKSLFFVIALTTLYLICFFTAKGINHSRTIAGALYLIPHLIIITSSLVVLQRTTKGIES